MIRYTSLQRVALLSFILVTSLHSPEAQAQEISEQSPVSLESFLQKALSHNSSLESSKHMQEAARHRIPQSWALPDPTAGYMVMGDMLETRLGPQEDVFELEQMVPFPAKLWQKRQMARAEFEAAQQIYSASKWDLMRDVASTYYDLYATDASIHVLEDVLDVLKGLESVAQARYATAGQPQRDVAKAQAEVSMTLERLLLLRQMRHSLEARMNSLLNQPSISPISALAPPPKPELDFTLEELLVLAEQMRPELRQAISLAARERHAKQLAKLEYLPDFSVGFQYVNIGSGMTTDPDDGRNAWMIPIKVTVPLWQNRLIAGIQEAKRNLQSSEASVQDEHNKALADVKDRYFRFQAAAQIVELYENALLPEAEIAFYSDRAGYEAGSQDALNLLDSERVYLNAKLAYYQALAERGKNFAELERATGTELRAGEAAP